MEIEVNKKKIILFSLYSSPSQCPELFAEFMENFENCLKIIYSSQPFLITVLLVILMPNLQIGVQVTLHQMRVSNSIQLHRITVFTNLSLNQHTFFLIQVYIATKFSYTIRCVSVLA